MNKKGLSMKKGSTWFLRAVLLVMALIAAAVCIFALPFCLPRPDCPQCSARSTCAARVGQYRLCASYLRPLPFEASEQLVLAAGKEVYLSASSMADKAVKQVCVVKAKGSMGTGSLLLSLTPMFDRSWEHVAACFRA